MASKIQTSPMNNVGEVIVGHAPNFWLFTDRHGFDLTHPSTPSAPKVSPRLTLHTTTAPVTIAPAKTALVIVDMQNFFLSAAMGRSRGEGHAAEDVLLKYGIPAARQAGIQVLWMMWGITEAGLHSLPPTVWRSFGWQGADEGDDMIPEDGSDASVGGGVLRQKERKSDHGIGSPLGQVKLKNGSTIDAGRMLIQNQWNTELHGPLQKAFMDGTKAEIPDVRFHKERISGFWDSSSPCNRFLKKQGIRTLLFTGVNTDQCVLASLQDACNQGWDTILLMDGCGTTSPGYTKQMVEYNCQKSWGFISSCKALFDGANRITKSEGADSHLKVESKDDM